MMRTLSVLLAAAAIAGCSSPTEIHSDIISARSESRTITITNESDDPVYYFAADREVREPGNRDGDRRAQWLQRGPENSQETIEKQLSADADDRVHGSP